MDFRRERLYVLLAALFSVIVIVSNLITVKLISLPFVALAVPCGLITYPLSFLIGDLITEIYGEQKARYVVYMGFGMALVSFLIIKISLILPAHPDWVSMNNHYGFKNSAQYQNAFASIFDINGIALVSSMLAYSAAQLMDIKLFAFLAEITHNKYLWLRNAGSTLISQIIDTLVVNVLLLYCGLNLDLDTVIRISLICYIYKLTFTLLNVPLFYAAVWGTRKYLKLAKSTHQLHFNEEVSIA